MAALVEEDDEVDVGGVVELARAHLAHGEDEHAGGLGDVGLGDAGELAAGDLVGDEGGEAELGGGVGEGGERAGDGGEVPGAAEVGEGGEERGAALGDAEGCRRGRPRLSAGMAARIAAMVASGGWARARSSQSASRAMRPARKVEQPAVPSRRARTGSGCAAKRAAASAAMARS